ncbi:MAG: FAD-dependent oxidoreductase [Pseudomonadota bacterium]
MNRFESDVVVVGAGLAGATAALTLAKRGVSVTLLERDSVALNRASLRNEGKIHLGLIYAAEPGAVTARQQLVGALSFEPVLRDLVGPSISDVSVGRPFAYLVPTDSLMTPDALEEHFEMLSDLAAKTMAEDRNANYLGRQPGRLARRMNTDEVAEHFNPDFFLGAFMTEELAIDTNELALVVRKAIADAPRLAFKPEMTVRQINRTPERILLEGDGAKGPWSIRASQVVNAAWDTIYDLDTKAGLAPPPGWLYRLKYRVMARLPEALEAAPSATLAIGAYGDVVVRPGGLSYLSWYPKGLQGWTDAIAAPDEWDGPSRGVVDAETFAMIEEGVQSGIGPWMPGIESVTAEVVDGGAILAHGKTDVDDPTSGLHGRAICGVTSDGNWHSLNPGKLTTAPLHGAEAAEAVLRSLGAAPEKAYGT